MLTEEENKKKKGIDVSSETKTVSIKALETEMSDDPKAEGLHQVHKEAQHRDQECRTS